MRITTIVFPLLAALLASGCVNNPSSLGRVPPRTNIVATYSASPSYDAVDKYSFTQAEILYPARQGHHRIAIGDYLLSDIFEILGSHPVKLLRLLSFSARCNPSGIFMPHVICDVDYRMEVHGREKSIIEGQLTKVDIGNQVALMPIVVSDEFFQNQVSPLLRATSADIRKKLSTHITQ